MKRIKGRKVFGYWLPFFGFVEEPLISIGDDGVFRIVGYADILVIEWLGHGSILFAKAKR